MIGAGLAEWENRGEMHRVEGIVFQLSDSSVMDHGLWRRRQHPPSVKAQKGRCDRRQLVRVKRALD